MPGLKKIHEEFSGRGFRLVSINTEPENIDGVRAFVRERALPFPVYVDNGSAQHLFRVRSFPTLFLVDRKGVVQDVHLGNTSAATLHEKIVMLLKE